MGWNFGDLLDATAAAVPAGRPALIHRDRVTTWENFDRRTNRVARAMRAAGLDVGDRVAILARNIPEFVEIAAAAFKARLTHVNINYRYTTAEIGYVLDDCGAAALFFEDEFSDTVAPLFGSASHLRLRVRIGATVSPVGPVYEELATAGDGNPLGIIRSPDDGYLLYTGGTTGRPKGVMWRSDDARAVQLEAPTIKALVTNMEEHVAMVRANPTPGRVIPACPLMHGAGLNSSMAELIGGGTVILLPSRRFDAQELWTEAGRNAATRVLIVGDAFARPMVRALEAHPRRGDLSALRIISSAGLTWSEEVRSALVRLLPAVTLVDILGASEASGFGYAISTREFLPATGIFEPGRNTVLIGVQDDRVFEPTEVGEGWLARRAPFAQGYYGDEANSAATYRTIGGVRYAIPGDLAARDERGHIRLIGRNNLCINTGGEKVFVEEVEEALKRVRGIEDALVVGVADPVWNSAVAALLCVELGYDESLARAELQGVLAAYKIPKYLLPTTELPRQASGKGDYRRALAIIKQRLSI
jgi:acyl-CoA synthetase (AMP-forming)/AMP-acid ligase II